MEASTELHTVDTPSESVTEAPREVSPGIEMNESTIESMETSSSSITAPSTDSLISAVTTIISHFMSDGSCPADSTLKTLISLIYEIVKCGNLPTEDHQTFQLLAAALLSQISNTQDLLRPEEAKPLPLVPPSPVAVPSNTPPLPTREHFMPPAYQAHSVPSTPLSNINQPVPSHNSYENQKMSQMLKDSTRNITNINCLSPSIVNPSISNDNTERDNLIKDNPNYSFSNDELNEIINTLLQPDQLSADQIKAPESSDLPTFLSHIPGSTSTSDDKNLYDHDVDDHVSRRKCKLCQKVFTTKGHLTVHLREVHFKIRDFACPFCSKAFSRSRYLRVHVQTVHRSEAVPDSKYNDNNDSFSDQGAPPTMLDTPSRIDNGTPNSIGDVISKFLPRNDTPVELQYPVDLQDSSFGKSSKSNLRHRGHGPRRHCLFCWKFLYDHELSHHVSRVHNTHNHLPLDDLQGPQIFTCSVCKTDIIQNKVLGEHIADLPSCSPTVCLTTLVQCTLCPATFTAGTIKDHYLDHHRIGNTHLNHPKIGNSKKYPSEVGECDVTPLPLQGVSSPQASSSPRSSWPCLFCSDVTESKEALKEHMRRTHYKNLVHECRFCPKEYHSLRDLRSHLLLQHREHTSTEDCFEAEPINTTSNTVGPLNPALIYSICHFCRISMLDPEKLQQHVEKVHFCSARALFLCSLCTDTFEKASHLKHHVSAAHFNNTKRHKQEFPVSSPTTSTEPTNAKEPSEKCPICEKSFDTSEHFKEAHSEAEIISSIKALSAAGQGNSSVVNTMMDVFKIVSQSEPDEVTLQKHLKFICKFCHKSFIREGHLFEHTKVVHLKVFDHVCLVCSKAFGRLRNLHAHFRTVHLDTTNTSEMSAESLRYLMGEECEHCNQTFDLPTDLTQHILDTHMSEQPEIDHVDPIEYLNTVGTPLLDKFQSELTALLDVYKNDEANSSNNSSINEVPHSINEVPYNEVAVKEEQPKFNSSRLSVPGGQTFPCPHCKFLFKRLSHLTEHVKSVHNKIRDYACTVCDSAFSRQRDLKQHLMKKHSFDSIQAALHARSQKPPDSSLLQSSLLQNKRVKSEQSPPGPIINTVTL